MKTIQVIQGVKIFPIKYLLENDLTESDIEVLLDEKSLSLKYSIVLGMFEYTHIYKPVLEILSIIKKDKWMYKYQWTYKECENYEKIITNIIKKLYYYSEEKSKSIAQWYIIMYGFQVKGNKVEF